MTQKGENLSESSQIVKNRELKDNGAKLIFDVTIQHPI